MKKEECKQVIIKAGKKLLNTGSMEIEEKTDFKNLVTSYDKMTQEFLISEFSKILPEATFLCEEDGVYDTSGEYTFIIDPIDGTSNFIFRYNVSAISVALAHKGDILWGIVYNPFADELYEAEKGYGAYLNGQPIHVTQSTFQHSIVGFGTSPYAKELHHETFILAEKALEECVDIRRSGSAALDCCYVARGSYGLYFELSLFPWDFAAGICIVKEAGGDVIDFNGNPPDIYSKTGLIVGSRQTIADFKAKILN